MSIDDRTPNLDLQLPHEDNVLQVDVARLRSSFATLDARVAAKAEASALSTKADLVGGKVPAIQLPSFVDDVIEVANLASVPTVGESGKIYVTLDTNKIYRWSGSIYVEVSASPGTSDAVPEGAVNKYFTDARALAAVPLATASVPGRIRPGAGFNVDTNGTLTYSGGSGITAMYSDKVLTVTTAGQTNFTVPGGYTPTILDVYVNGVLLVAGDDFTATDGAALVLAQGVATTDTVVARCWVLVSIANAVAKTGDTMLGPLGLPGNASGALHAVPLQQLNSVATAAQTAAQTYADSSIELYRGTDTRIAALPPTALYDNNYSTMIAKISDGRLVAWGDTRSAHTGSGNLANTSMRPGFCQFAPRIPSGVTIAGFAVGSADSFVWLSNGWVYHAGANARGIGGHGAAGVKQMFTRIASFFNAGLSVIDVQPSANRSDDQYSNATFLCSNGEVYFAGYAEGGVAGDGLTATRNIFTPTRCLGVTGAVAISQLHDSNQCRFAWRADGTVYAWGNDYFGMLGLGAPATNHTPAVIPGILVNKVASRLVFNSLGDRYGHTLFLLKDGTVRAAGYNFHGQLGDGTTTNRSSPVAVPGLTNVVDVGVGGGDLAWSWAVTADKQLWQWGYNAHGGLGVGDTTARTSPVQPVGWIDEGENEVSAGAPPFQGKVKKVVTSKTVAGNSVGAQQVVVLDEDGNVWSAGENRTYTVGWNATGRTLRFKRAALMAVAPGDKIVDIHMQGTWDAGSATTRLFALTQSGRILVSGTNNYELVTTLPGTSNNNYTAVFLQPIRLCL
jgi:alpha-tubulin suppressor-like RCC1 family protein